MTLPSTTAVKLSLTSPRLSLWLLLVSRPFLVCRVAARSLPVIFVPSPALDGARKQLPYAATWLDYCEFAFLAPESAAKDSNAMRLLLDQLGNVSAHEAAKRRRALLRVRDAFVARPPRAGRAQSSAGSGGGRSRGGRSSKSEITHHGSESDASPSMADFLVREACELAHRERLPSLGQVRGELTGARRRRRPAFAGMTADTIRRCMLGGARRTAP